MKKTLVALAALATVGAAFAQSSVTLYGKIDWEVQSSKTKTGGVTTGDPGLKVNSAGLSGSRWGMKGSEDLGGGMSAIFQLEGGFAVDTAQTAQCNGSLNVVSVNPCTVSGAAAAAAGGTSVSAPRLFGRQAYAGLKGNWGQLTVGRQYAPYDNAFGAIDSQGYTTNSAMGAAWARGVHADAGVNPGTGRVDNQVTYFTPAMGGFNAQVSWAPGEDGAPGISPGRYWGLGLGYGNGPLNVQFAYESMKTREVANATLGQPSSIPGSVAVGGPGTTNAWLVGGSYDFGIVKPYIGYERASKSNVAKDRGWELGVGVPIGAATLSVGYARETSRVTGAAFDSKSTSWGGQLVYPLSKRTNVYAEFFDVRDQTAAAASVTTRTRNYGVGMRHDF